MNDNTIIIIAIVDPKLIIGKSGNVKGLIISIAGRKKIKVNKPTSKEIDNMNTNTQLRITAANMILGALSKIHISKLIAPSPIIILELI